MSSQKASIMCCMEIRGMKIEGGDDSAIAKFFGFDI